VSGASAAPEPTVAELLATVQALATRVESLESELAAVRAHQAHDQVPEEVVLAISAAVAAFLGHRAKLKQVRYRSGAAWTQQGRAAVQGHQIMHGVR
jgi:methylmalonyl-CoA carboxyltransferase large subunit